MSTAFPILSFEEVESISQAVVDVSVTAKKLALFRTGTAANSPLPAVGEAFVFQTGANQFVGSGILALANGRYRLPAGTYWMTSIVRSGNYSDPTGLIVWQWRNFTSGAFVGGQAIHYANASTSAFTHQPTMNALVVVPEGQTVDVGPALVGLTSGLAAVVSELRSSSSILRVA